MPEYQHLLPDQRSMDVKIGKLLTKFQTKVRVYPPGTCPLTVQLSMLQASKNQTCGKCVPCRDGLPQLERMMRRILDGDGTAETLRQMKVMAEMIRDSADCAIGYQTAIEVLEGLETFRDEYESHVTNKMCPAEIGQKVPCVNLCPAHVNIPAYIALIAKHDYAGAVQMIRKDNPLPTACAFVCEHPCEERCRRNLIDDSLNIRGLKKYAVDHAAADIVPVPRANRSTGKKIAVIGGGPAGLTAAYYLGLMGHAVVIYERQPRLGGMLRYGIPSYRFPKNRLQEDIRAIVSAGHIRVVYQTCVGKDISVAELRERYDAMFVAIGAQAGKTLRIEGEDAGNVFSAVEMLDRIGNGVRPDYTGKSVIVVGGGNVAMDAARTAVRCGAADVSVVYRRRKEDMTALQSEIASAVEEGIGILTLRAPLSIEVDKEGNCAALIVQPQMTGLYKDGRPAPMKADKPPERIPGQVILVAVGQDIVSGPFEEYGMKTKRGAILAGRDTAVQDHPGIFAGGDCVTGPATVIRAVAAGRAAAFNIDEYLGYHHKVECAVETPEAKENNRLPTGRSNIMERPPYERKRDFWDVETSLSYEEAMQEADRCLRCDHFGCGVLKGGMDQ